MKNKDKRTYRLDGLEFSNLEFMSDAEQRYVASNVSRIAEKIRELRKNQNLSQEKLAELTSTSLSTIRSLELSQRAPSLPMLLKILYVLDRKAKIWD